MLKDVIRGMLITAWVRSTEMSVDKSVDMMWYVSGGLVVDE